MKSKIYKIGVSKSSHRTSFSVYRKNGKKCTHVNFYGATPASILRFNRMVNIAKPSIVFLHESGTISCDYIIK